MSNINLYQVYNSKLRKHSVLTDSQTFRDAFVDAVNFTYDEFNDQVFQAETLSRIESFDDITDNRLSSFTSLTFDADSNTEVGSREYWSVEYDLERMSATNGFTDTIADDASNVVISIANNTITITGDSVVGSVSLTTETDILKIVFQSSVGSNSLSVNGEEYGLTYTTGDAETTQSIGTVSSHVINGVSGFELLSTRFLSSGTVIYDFPLNEGTGTAVEDDIAEYEGTIVSPVWSERYIEPSSSLSTRYSSPFSMAIDYHLQDGGEWSIDSDLDLQSKWYGRGIRQARNIYQQTTTYTSPLGI